MIIRVTLEGLYGVSTAQWTVRGDHNLGGGGGVTVRIVLTTLYHVHLLHYAATSDMVKYMFIY